ncbi:hypothetical protein H3H32_11305 [Spirosoma foliorum]|uniref:Uncharacterized protein n=1 Tax=Spirosoma foliorum TaxID=2710596 RepID=A0A7G5H2T5_9BACT|nr:hypothetical protein H3H32_11305 [Spirosoma foliorum]
MRDQFRNGATGVLVSGIVWLTTAVVLNRFSTKQAIWALLVGGALIYPISTLIDRLSGTRVPTHQSNPLTGLAMEGIFFMLMTIPIAYGLSLQRPECFFSRHGPNHRWPLLNVSHPVWQQTILGIRRSVGPIGLWFIYYKHATIGHYTYGWIHRSDVQRCAFL